IEHALASARTMEAALRTERERMRRMQQSYRRTCLALEDRIREAEARAHESMADRNRQEAALIQQRRREESLLQTARALHQEFKRGQAELKRYQSAWAGVLQREREARDILAESRANKQRREELERRLDRSTEQLQAEARSREQAVRHAKSY